MDATGVVVDKSHKNICIQMNFLNRETYLLSVYLSAMMTSFFFMFNNLAI